MKNLCLTALTIVLFLGNIPGQNTGRCGMTRDQLDAVTARLLVNLKNAPEVSERAVKYLPVRMILVANDDGSGRVKERNVLQMLCSLNERYVGTGFRFYLENGEFKYLNASNVYTLQTGSSITKMKLNRSTKAINYFITDKCDFGSSPGSNLEILGYYTPDNDWLVIKRAEVNAISSTTPHETGHFFSLLHPFNGWDQTPWVKGSTACAPTFSPDDNMLKTEKVDGTNSGGAGDFIKDTPASFNFVLDQSDCTGNAYGGGARDVNCTALKNVTQADNYMDYFANCQNYQFTPMQNAAMLADLNSSDRNFLDNTYSPPAESLAAPADMCISPINGAAADYSDKFTFKWNAVPGATLYFLEIGLTTSISNSSVYQQLVKTTEHTVNLSLTANKPTYWRVTPMNEYVMCMGTDITSLSQKFTTGATSGTVSIEGLGDWGISPNPFCGQSEITLKTTVDNPFLADIEISSVSGQVVFAEKGHEFASGESDYLLPTGDLGAGIYLVSIAQPTGRLTKKLVVY